MILGTTKQMQQTCAAALASPDSKKTQGTPEATERKSALAFYSALRPVHAGGAGAAVSPRSKGRELIKYVAAAAVKSKCGANMSVTGGVQGMSLAIKTRARAPGQHDATSSCLPACARACGERARVTIHTHSRAHACQSRATHSQSRRALTQARHDAVNTYTGARGHLQKARLRQSAHARA